MAHETQQFDTNPILNSPYCMPTRYWILDDGRPTGNSADGRRKSEFLIPIPAARKGQQQAELPLETKDNALINNIRSYVDKWREFPSDKWNVSYTTRQLLLHWRGKSVSPRLFFCQIEAAETMIWLNEVAPQTAAGKKIIQEIKDSNADANPLLFRLAAKMATGAGKTTVMAMLIAYHAINKVRSPKSTHFSKNFLIITPGITIRDRLQVLKPEDGENYYSTRDIVPSNMLDDIKKAQVIIQNFHAFLPRETRKLTTNTRQILEGNSPDPIATKESDGEMLLRACENILRAKDVIVINDEAHHCFRHKVEVADLGDITTEEKDEVKKSHEAARVWISGIEALVKKVQVRAVYDLSATPFFLKIGGGGGAKGLPEGTLFPWVVSDFALMDAIESGIVKLPRVPIADGTIEQLPIYRNIYQYIKKDLPRKGARNQGNMNPEKLPSKLMGALTTLYGHYENTFKLWEAEKVGIPPVFIIVCNNTATSKLVYDLVSGYKLPNGRYKKGKLKLFSNIDEDGELMSRPHTLLIDSVQLESGDALSNEFKQVAADEIETFKQEMRVRYPGRGVENISDGDILRGVMNTVGKKDKMGEQIRCVVSVSMLTEGWDANNVTHILGIRAFGTQLLCEQVVGRALRRLSYDTDEHDKFAPEYADVFGVPFVFANSSKAEPIKPKPQTRIRHLEERRFFEINYPRLRGYKYAPPESRLVARFNENSRLVLRPEDAPPNVQQSGIVGKKEIMTLDELKQHRINEVVFTLASYTAKEHYRNEDGSVSPERFRDLIPIVRDWMDDYLTCLDNTFKQYLLWESLMAKAANRIYRACTVHDGKEKLLPVFDPFTPEGSTYDVDFLTSKKRLHPTVKSHINIAVCDSDWEMNFCQLLEDNTQVYAYTRNAGLGFQVPYIADNKKERQYFPDFIIIANDKDDENDLLNLVIEIKGFKDGDSQAKADTMNRLWIPAMNNDGRYGRWAFAEIMDMQNARKILANLTKSGQKKIAYV